MTDIHNHKITSQCETYAKVFEMRKEESVLDQTHETYNVCNINFGSPNLGSHVQDKRSVTMFTH